ncbi:peptidase [Thermohalobacter berrensis]|uniref:Peptidase n=2 Tax=Thermohalobacter berrensis TaxID=99594 RepID=A0A419TBD6_9FIRM|nr:peptidase [Thermohalobacter berrensis]
MISTLLSTFINKLIILPGLLIAITLHELAHGFTAYLMGDATAKNNGRLSLNPIVHIDPIGFLLLFVAGFGWAKPVPVNPMYFNNRKMGTILVSLAGPLANFILSIISAIILVTGIITNSLIIKIFELTLLYNIVLGVFNLLPFPPLDGSKILASILPTKYEMLFYRYEKYTYLLLIFLIMTNVIDRLLNPLIILWYNLLVNITNILL